MKLEEYKERDIPGWHEPNVTEKCLLKNKKGKIIGAYFPETNVQIDFLIDFIIDKSKQAHTGSSIPHVFGDRKLESLFFGGLRLDGSIGRHCAMIAQAHKEESNNELMQAISLLSYEGIEFAGSQYAELKEIFNQQKNTVKLMCDSQVCISDHYTSGSVNFDGLLGLHYDTVSLPNVLNLIFYKKDGNGGNLIIPHEGICIDSKTYSLAILNVKDNMHGVSAFKGSYRDSIIYYAINQMG